MLMPIKLLSFCVCFGMAIETEQNALIKFHLEDFEVCEFIPTNLEIFPFDVMECEPREAFCIPAFHASSAQILNASCFNDCVPHANSRIEAEPALRGSILKFADGKITSAVIARLEPVDSALFKLHAVPGSKRRAFEAVLSYPKTSSDSVYNSRWLNLATTISASMTRGSTARNPRRTDDAFGSLIKISTFSFNHRRWRDSLSTISANPNDFDLWSHECTNPSMTGRLMAIGIAPCDRSLVKKEVSNFPLLK
jgi:hypothetical protein